jgi:hypothetical protein
MASDDTTGGRKDADPLGEGLFAPATVRLFGRRFDGLEIKDLGLNPASNNPLVLSLLKRTELDKSKQLARIYGFSYQGNYYKMSTPAVFLVYGEGEEVVAGYQDAITLSKMGVEFKDAVFSKEVRVWPADQLDVAVRIDITIGWLSDVLLADEVNPDNNMTGGMSSRSDLVGRDGNLVGRDGNLVGRDGNLISPSRRRF